MSEKTIKTRIIHKHAIESNWAKATNFVPKQGEIIIYDDRYIDSDGNEVIVADDIRWKIGDGVTSVNDLRFSNDALISRLETKAEKKYFYTENESIVLSDGINKVTFPELEHDIAVGDIISHNAEEFEPAKNIIRLVTNGEIVLSDNSIYSITSTGDIIFTLPSIDFLDLDKVHKIEVELYSTLEHTITLNESNDVLYQNCVPPVIYDGIYRLSFIYDTNHRLWCVSCVECRVDWSEALGLRVDYENCIFERLEAAENKSEGADFDSYAMYGGRRRCNVADDGTILAYEGEDGYVTDGTNGQVMVYQPAFYYKVIPLILDGNKIRKAEYYVSEKPLVGFKRHPAFYDTNGNEIDYILLSAYEACIYDADGGDYGTGAYLLDNEQVADYTTDKLSSISGASPCSNGNQNLTKANAERLAQNRGSGWHIDHVLSWSVQQLLALIEVGHFDMQTHIGNGMCIESRKNRTGASDTYSNPSGGNTSSQKESMRYRWCENLYGNVSSYLGGVSVAGDTVFCGLNYDFTHIQTKTNLPIQTTKSIQYISAFSYDTQFDWMFIPCELQGTSVEPVGDTCVAISYLNGDSWMVGYDAINPLSYYQRVGLFSIKAAYVSEKTHQGCRLLFVPTAETEDAS